jgi:hypothetical protein
MRRTILTRLSMIFIILLIATALHSAATAQSVSVSDSRATALAPSGGGSDLRSSVVSSSRDDVCEQRLNKALDALDKAEKALNFAMTEIDARKQLDALKDQYIAVKDLIIAEQDKLIKRLQKGDNSVWGRVKKILGIAEKALLVGIGIYVGRGL